MRRCGSGGTGSVRCSPTSSPPSDEGLVQRVQAYEAELIRESLTRYHGYIRQIVAELKVPRKTLYDKMSPTGSSPRVTANVRSRVTPPDQLAE